MSTIEPAVMAMTISSNVGAPSPEQAAASPPLSAAPGTTSATTLAGTAGVAGTPVRLCAQCGAVIVRRRRSNKQNETLCVPCDQRERRASYFRAYYENHKDGILNKNRRWAKDNRDRLVRLRQARYARRAKSEASPRTCVECGVAVARALRCRRCYIRFRYATDPAYRARRLATTRRWLERRTVPDRQRESFPAAKPATGTAVQLTITPN